MTKRFSQIVEEIKKKREESESLGPKAKGEQDFAAQQGFPPKIGGPMDKAYPIKGSDDVVNARSAKKTSKHNLDPRDNELDDHTKDKTPKTQGSSKVTQPSGSFGKQTSTSANDRATAGDKNVVRTSPSAVKGISEQVITQLESIAYSNLPGSINFADGDSAMISPATAATLLDTYRKLNIDNASKFAATLSEGTTGFLKMMKFTKA